MEVITKDDLANKLGHFERAVNSVRQGQDQGRDFSSTYPSIVAYRLDYANGGVRVETQDESRTVSPRLTRRGLANWFDAALRALEEVTRG